MMCSSILGRQTSESKVEVPAFLRHFSKARPLFVFIFRKSESRPRAFCSQQNGCAREEIFSFCICTTFVILMSILNALTQLITLLLYSGHQFKHCMVLLCVQYNVKLCCLWSAWFAKEANVANNKQRLAYFMPR